MNAMNMTLFWISIAIAIPLIAIFYLLWKGFKHWLIEPEHKFSEDSKYRDEFTAQQSKWDRLK